MNLLSRVKRFLFAVIIVIQASFLNAQQTRQGDILYLRNGSILKGTAVRMVMEGECSFRTNEGYEIRFDAKQVLRMDKGDVPIVPSSEAIHKAFQELDTSKTVSTKEDMAEYGFGRHSFTVYIGAHLRALDSVGVSLLGQESAFALGHGFIYGYRFVPRYTLGIGTMIQTYSRPMVGLMLDNRFYLRYQSDAKLFVRGSIGYSKLLANFRGDDSKGGLLLDGGFGVALWNGRKKHILMSIGMMRQAHRYLTREVNGIELQGQGEEVEVVDYYNRVVFRFGYMF